MTRAFRIYGDNIVECNRVFRIILSSIAETEPTVSLHSGPLVTPVYRVDLVDKSFEFQYIPGHGSNRWSYDLFKLLDSFGSLLREAPDSLVTELKDTTEVPLFAIEFCGALPAGNQAWQRNGRALSFAYTKIPYFYITELGGFELTGERERKAARTPNPLVPFSYVNCSVSFDSPSLPIYVASPGASEESKGLYRHLFSDQLLEKFIRLTFYGRDTSEVLEELSGNVTALVELLASNRSSDDSLNSEEWSELYAETIRSDGDIADTISESYTKAWRKVVSIPKTETFSSLLEFAFSKSEGVTSENLPISLVQPEKRGVFADYIQQLYGSEVSDEFVSFIREGSSPLGLAWIAGFKPRGDDARPDRGLCPLLRMTLGEKADLLAIVYGPAKRDAIDLLKSNSVALAKKNGLWESILKTSDAVLVDSLREDSANRAFLFSSQRQGTLTQTPTTSIQNIDLLKPGEHDVDTIIQTVFSRLSCFGVFEGLCNPPGGDWSGISLKSELDGSEYRWLTLPRVTAEGQKRPDHVFQLFSNSEKLTVIIESKEKVKSLETNIGSRLIKYVETLISSPPHVEREHSGADWKHSAHHFDGSSLFYVSVGAGIGTSPNDLIKIAESGQLDLVLGFDFSNLNGIVISTLASTERGRVVQNAVRSFSGPYGLIID